MACGNDNSRRPLPVNLIPEVKFEALHPSLGGCKRAFQLPHFSEVIAIHKIAFFYNRSSFIGR
jgi:hypothetical protein